MINNGGISVIGNSMPHYDLWKTDNNTRIAQLTETDFFQSCLLPDIRTGDVFPAIRNQKIDFYHLGQKLCSYYPNHGFCSNIAYLSAFQNRPSGEVFEQDYGALQLCSSFERAYSQMKDNIRLYKQPESSETFELCRSFSIFLEAREQDGYSIIDCEIQRRINGKDIRPDLLLYKKSDNALRFIEVKAYRSRDLRAVNGQLPVMRQLESYNESIANSCDSLRSDYIQYMELLGEMIKGLAFPDCVVSIEERIDLLIVGFNNQEQNYINQNVVPKLSPFQVHSIGKAARATQATLNQWWNA